MAMMKALHCGMQFGNAIRCDGSHDSITAWKGEVRITDNNGVLSGVVVRALKEDPKAKTVCDLCKDDRKGQKIIGMEILRNLTREGKDSDYLWAGKGTILDPDNGKVYDVKMVPVEGGKRLRVRGYIGPFYRTQFWERAQ